MEFLAQCETAVHQEAAVLMRGQEAEVVQQDATGHPATANESGGSRIDM